jgi:hypothetical protein
MTGIIKHAVLACTALLVMPVALPFSSNDTITAMKHKSSSSITNDVQQKEIENESIQGLPTKRKAVIGAWAPYQMLLEEIKSPQQQEKAMKALLEKGFVEYYFVMTDFKNSNAKERTEKLLTSADKTGLEILIILLPPSEGGPNGNYDWNGWIHYFNNLKGGHESLKGFTIDDFNWISTRNDTKFRRNVDYMTYSNFSDALDGKKEDVHFYPVIYFEGEKTQTVIKEYGRFIDGIIMASACYYNITNLKGDLQSFSKMFDNRPIRYVVYPTTTYNYTRYNYSPPSDQLIMATLSIATKGADGIILWTKIDSPVIENYLSEHDNPKYLSEISMLAKEQMRDEKIWKQANPSLVNSTLFQRYCHL